jgi:hypothetical protein
MSDAAGFSIVLALIFAPATSIIVATIGGHPIIGALIIVVSFLFLVSLSRHSYR